MLLENLYEFFIIFGVWMFIISLAIFVSSIGVFFFYKSIKNDLKTSRDFVRSTFAGITGGIIVAIVISLRENGDQNIFSYMLIIALLIFFIGVMTYLNSRFLSRK